MPAFDQNSFVFGSGGGAWNPNTNYGVSSWAKRGSAPAGVTTNPGQAIQNSFTVPKVGDIETLTKQLNDINQAAQTKALQGRIPGNPDLEKKSSANIANELAGQVPQDVINLLAQQGAERGATRGLAPDAANSSAAYLRALGLTSLDQMKTGQANLTAADARNPIAPIVDASKYTLTPDESAKINLAYLAEANRMQLERERLAAELARNNRNYGGGGGGNGFSLYGGGGGGLNDIGYFGPTMVGRAPTAGTGPTYGDVGQNPAFTTADWLTKTFGSANPNFGGAGNIDYGGELG